METIIKHKEFGKFLWIDICDPDLNRLDSLAKEFGLDYFQIRDSLERGHLPKIEKQKNYIFLILRAFTGDFGDGATTIPEISNKIAFFFNEERIITIHRSSFDFLNEVRSDLEDPESLLLFIIHKMLGTYDLPLKQLSEKIDEIERKVFLADHGKVSLKDLYFLKTQTRITKKLLQIIQNVVNQLEVGPSRQSALQDLKDNLLSLLLGYEEVLDNSFSLLNTYLSVNAQKNNDVVKTLTIFSAFFLPLTFLAGIYGMNFRFMPEILWPWGYPLALTLMSCIALLIFFWFRKKKIL